MQACEHLRATLRTHGAEPTEAGMEDGLAVVVTPCHRTADVAAGILRRARMGMIERTSSDKGVVLRFRPGA